MHVADISEAVAEVVSLTVTALLVAVFLWLPRYFAKPQERQSGSASGRRGHGVGNARDESTTAKASAFDPESGTGRRRRGPRNMVPGPWFRRRLGRGRTWGDEK